MTSSRSSGMGCPESNALPDSTSSGHRRMAVSNRRRMARPTGLDFGTLAALLCGFRMPPRACSFSFSFAFSSAPVS